jgi:formate hydrogenlyase transcriptional activator
VASPLPPPPDTQYSALLQVADAILAHRDLNALFRDLSRLLRQVVPFDYINLVLYDPELEAMRLRILEATVPLPEAPKYQFIPLAETPSGFAWSEQGPVVIPDIAVETRWPRIIGLLRGIGISSGCYIPLSSAQRRLGVLGFGFVQRHEFTPAEIAFMENVAAPVAVAVDNALNHDQLSHERDRLKALLDITNALVSNLDESGLFQAITSCLKQAIRHDYASLALTGPSPDTLRLKALDFPRGQGFIREDMVFPTPGSLAGAAAAERKAVRFSASDLAAAESEVTHLLRKEGIRSILCVPLITRNGVLGTLNVASFEDEAFSKSDVEFMTQVANQVAVALENAFAYRQISELKNKLAEEKLYLEDEIRSERNFSEMVGESAAFQHVLRQIETVAPTDATVLILGETGTGKELIARAIHQWSVRNGRTFVKLNCAAIPTGLLESELFGHERGAFTGAIAQRIGRLELADKGTLFLDEIGDIPLELQPKLLRALQEHEFERLGSTRTIRVDVRLIAATNRDLPKMVSDREFRTDLYYRLNVFPIQVPPLRDRINDIPILVRYFAQKYARRMNRKIETIPAESMAQLQSYVWPGNVRELENLIERAVILSRASVLEIPALGDSPSPAPDALPTMEAAEREHILRALRETNGVLGGTNGAAAKLGMKRTTLQSRMKKLGIRS